MENPRFSFSATNYLYVTVILLGLISHCVLGGSKGNHGWSNAHATFYGDLGGQETMCKPLSIFSFIISNPILLRDC